MSAGESKRRFTACVSIWGWVAELGAQYEQGGVGHTLMLADSRMVREESRTASTKWPVGGRGGAIGGMILEATRFLNLRLRVETKEGGQSEQISWGWLIQLGSQGAVGHCDLIKSHNYP